MELKRVTAVQTPTVKDWEGKDKIVVWVHFAVVGTHGAVSWCCNTGVGSTHPGGGLPLIPHSPYDRPGFELGGECEYLNAQCWCNGSFREGKKMFEILLRGGQKAIWEELENQYDRWFNEKKEEVTING